MNEQYYINRLGTQLKGFAKKSATLFNFSCPICGDSSKTSKKRGYIFKKKNNWLFFCHNCNASQRFTTFLKSQNPVLFKEFQLDIFSEKKKVRPTNVEEKEVTMSSAKPSFSKKPEKCKYRIRAEKYSIPFTSDAECYIIDRKVSLKNFLYTDKFYEFCNRVLPQSFDLKKVGKYDHPRIIIPFYDETGNLILFQGRAMGDQKPKYITIKINEDVPKIYGLDKLNTDKPIYVVEGVFDAMSIDNAIAVLDSNYVRAGNYFDKTKLVVIPDLDTRNLQVLKSIKKCIDQGFAVSLLKKINGKDLNEIICSGVSKEALEKMINKFTTRGAKSALEFIKWRKR